ncbi:MAG: hypothetical protein GY856_11935 [bacterium]|nr:hypothetical protein [bacterium]
MLKQRSCLGIVRNGKRIRPHRKSIGVLPMIAVVLFFLQAPVVAAYPSAGFDRFDSSATVTIDLTLSGGPIMANIEVAGRVEIQRSDPYDPGDGRITIDTEITKFQLRGMTDLGPITITESPTLLSTGEIKQQSVGVDYPADSFFDVFVDIDGPTGLLYNTAGIHLEATIYGIPPLRTDYLPPGIIGVDLYVGDPPVAVGVILHAKHFVGQTPSFSVAPAGASGLNPHEIFDVPTAPRIAPAALGLAAGDDIASLSYGVDFIEPETSVRFSVDPGTVGVQPSAVYQEANKMPQEAKADEFGVPPVPGGPLLNYRKLDETGDTAPPFPLLISDDVDSLAESKASLVDTDGDGIPDLPVYFSLASGSPTLATIPASPADILTSVGGAPPTIFIPAASLALVAGDVVDALCLDPATGVVAFSLAPTSPTLGTYGLSAADLLGGVPTPIVAPPPPVWKTAAALGLLTSDDLNAVKCVPPVPVELISFTVE